RDARAGTNRGAVMNRSSAMFRPRAEWLGRLLAAPAALPSAARRGCRPSGRALLAPAGLLASAGALLASAGALLAAVRRFLASAGALLASAGALLAPAGALLASAGALLAPAGALLASAGALLASAGALLAPAGALLATVRRLLAAVRRFLATAGGFLTAGAFAASAAAASAALALRRVFHAFAAVRHFRVHSTSSSARTELSSTVMRRARDARYSQNTQFSQIVQLFWPSGGYARPREPLWTG